MPTDKVDHKWYEALQRIAAQLEGHSQVALYFIDDDTSEGVDAERTLRHFLEMYGLRVPVDTSAHKVPLADGKTFPASEPPARERGRSRESSSALEE